MDNRENQESSVQNDKEEISSTTQFSYNEAVANVKKRHRFFKLSKLGWALSALLSGTYLALYFSLPSFQAENRKITGNEIFSAEDIVLLSENSGYKPDIFFSPSNSRETLRKNSQGFFLDAAFGTDGFSVQAEVDEDVPGGILGGVTYFCQGNTYDERVGLASKLPLPSKNIAKIKTRRETLKSAVPVIHLPSQISIDEASEKEAFEYIPLLPSGVLRRIAFIDYVSTSDVTWNNLANFIIQDKDSGNYILFENLLRDKLNVYFKTADKFENDFKAALDDSKKHTPVSYERKDGSGETIEVYSYRLVINNGNVSVVRS